MVSLISILLTIVMAFASFSGVTAAVTEPVSFEAKIAADGATIMALTGAGAGTAGTDTAEGTVSVAKVIEDVLSILTFKGVANQGAAELDVYAGEDVLLSIGVKNGEESSVLASSLLGSQVISVSAEQIQQMQQQTTESMVQGASGINIQSITEQLQNLDTVQITADVQEVLTKLEAALQEKQGETENGEFTVDGMAFTGKTPVNATYDELIEMAFGGFRELMAKESLQPIVQIASQGGTDLAAEIDKALEDIKNQPAEEKPELQIAIYTDADNCAYTVCDASRKGSEDGTVKAEETHIGYGLADGKTKLIAISNESSVDLTAVTAEDGACEILANLKAEGVETAATVKTSADGTYEMTCDAQYQGLPVKIKSATTKDGERENFQMEVFLFGAEKPLVTISCSSGKGGEMISAFEGESVTTVPYEKLADENDTTAANQIQMTLMGKLMQAITVLTKNLPEETATWLSSQIATLMNPGGSTTETPGSNE